MEGLTSRIWSRKLGFAIECNIRSRHDAIMRISEAILDEIERDELAITDTLEKAARASIRDKDHLILGSGATNSLENPLNDSTSGLGSKCVADEHFTDEGSKIPICVVRGSKPPCKNHGAIFDGNVFPSPDVSTLTAHSKPNARPMSRPTDSVMTTSNDRDASNKQDANKTEAKTAEWEETPSKNASFVLDSLPTMLEKSSHKQPTLSDQIPKCHIANGFSRFSSLLPNETQSSRLEESASVKGEIPSDSMGSGMVHSKRKETAFSKQDPLSLLELVPDVPKDIINICWRYQHLDDKQLENMRHHMISKAFGYQGKGIEESVP